MANRTPVGLALRIALAALSLSLSLACGEDIGNDSDLVGGSCRDDRDCVERCVEGKDFPSGTCTVACDDDRDCPSDTWCIDKAGGVCLLACDVDDHCRGGYRCKNTDREGAGGKIEVCIDD